MSLLRNKLCLIFVIFCAINLIAQKTDSYANKAFFSYQKNDFINALKYLDSTSVKNEYIFSLKGKSLMQVSDFAKAIPCFLKANQYKEKFSDYELALCYAQLDKFDSTSYYLELNLTGPYKKRSNVFKFDTLLTAYRKSPKWSALKIKYPYTDSEKSLERAIYYSTHNQVDLALDILDELISNDKKNQDYYYYRAQYILLFNKDYKYAIGDMKKAIKYDNSQSNYYEFLGDCYAKIDRYKKANESYLMANNLYPYSQDLRYKISFSFFRLGEYLKAEKHIKSYILINNQNINALKLMGLILYEVKQYRESVNYLYKACSIDSRRADLLIARGKSYMAIEEYQNALWDFGTATDLDSRNGEFWFYKGLAFLYEENQKEACKCFKRARNLLYYQADEYLLKECD